MNKLKYIILGLVLGSSIVFGRTIVDTILKLGNGTDVDIKLEAELGKGVANPALNYDSTNDKWQFCNEGEACADMGSGGGGGGGVPLLGKGSLLTSDGVTNGEFTACADDELIVWDAAEVAGFKCAAAPSGGVSYNCTRLYKTVASAYGADATVLSIPVTIGNTYQAFSKYQVSGSGADIKDGSLLLMRSFKNNTTVSGWGITTPPFQATTSAITLRSIASQTFYGVADSFKINFTWLEVCEITGGSVSRTFLN